MSNYSDRGERRDFPKGAAYLLILFCVVAGALLVLWGAKHLWYARASRGWSRAEGRIEESRWVPGSGRSTTGYAKIKYRYAVGGRTYEGRNILPGGGEYPESDEEAKVRQYRVGSAVTIFYDPERPESSSLEVGVVTRIPFLLLGLGVFSLACASSLGWRLRRGLRLVPAARPDERPPVEDYHFLPRKR
jgi:hypothetical protein